MSEPPALRFTENGLARELAWRSESGAAPPARVEQVDDSTPADLAYGLAAQGVGLLWRGDYHNARQLLAALDRRASRRAPAPGASPAETFHRVRQARAQRARTLGLLLVELDAGGGLALRRAPELRAACQEAMGAPGRPTAVALRELLGWIGAAEWRKKGVEVPALGARVHPHYGVFAPVRGEYVRLVAEAPLPPARLAIDVGTGTGVLAAVLAKRGLPRLIATDADPRALACAAENLARLGLAERVRVVAADLFPPEPADLFVCNPPWVPARPSSALERAIYDPDSAMLRGFLGGLAGHLNPGGEGWLVLSDLAEHLGLRTRAALLGWIAAAGLQVVDRLDTRPSHPKALDPTDPLHAARAAELVSLWRLRRSPPTGPAG